MIKKTRVPPRNGLIAALDIGTSKMCCFIARVGDDGRPTVVGIGHQLSRGVRSGAIIDMEQAELALRTTVHAAEQMAGETIQDVVINLSGGYPASQTVGVEVPISGREIAEHDLHRVLLQGAQVHGPVDRRLIHSIPVGYSIDGSKGIRDPRGMFAEKLGVDRPRAMSLVTWPPPIGTESV
jgi:cell division protein FtsA